MPKFKEEQLVRVKKSGLVGRLWCIQAGDMWPEDELWGFISHSEYGDIELESPDEIEIVEEPDLSPKAILSKLDLLGERDGLDITETGLEGANSIYVSGTLDGLPISFNLTISNIWEGD